MKRNTVLDEYACGQDVIVVEVFVDTNEELDKLYNEVGDLEMVTDIEKYIVITDELKYLVNDKKQNKEIKMERTILTTDAVVATEVAGLVTTEVEVASVQADAVSSAALGSMVGELNVATMMKEVAEASHDGSLGAIVAVYIDENENDVDEADEDETNADKLTNTHAGTGVCEVVTGGTTFGSIASQGNLETIVSHARSEDEAFANYDGGTKDEASIKFINAQLRDIVKGHGGALKKVCEVKHYNIIYKFLNKDADFSIETLTDFAEKLGYKLNIVFEKATLEDEIILSKNNMFLNDMRDAIAKEIASTTSEDKSVDKEAKAKAKEEEKAAKLAAKLAEKESKVKAKEDEKAAKLAEKEAKAKAKEDVKVAKAAEKALAKEAKDAKKAEVEAEAAGVIEIDPLADYSVELTTTFAPVATTEAIEINATPTMPAINALHPIAAAPTMPAAFPENFNDDISVSDLIQEDAILPSDGLSISINPELLGR